MYFQTGWNVGRIKSEYRRLAKQNHPDVGGLTAIMQAINAAYHAALQAAHGQTTTGTDNRQHTYYYNESREQAVMDKISHLLGLRLPSDVTIDLVGTWVWVYGNTRPHRAALKAAKCRWHSKRNRWYWRQPGGRKRKYNSHASFSDLQNAYGSRQFHADDETTAAAAA